MIKPKSIKWSYGILLLSLTFGLSGCLMDDQFGNVQNHPDQQAGSYGQQSPNQAKSTGQQTKTVAARDPVQATTPGPKRAAAPQLPVIE